MVYKREYSAGGIVTKREGNTLLFLLGKHSGYHKWVLPKGLIEAGEAPQATAVRETQEEMGVIARVIDEIPLYVAHYWYVAEYKPTQEERNSSEPRSLESAKVDPVTRRVLTYQEAGGSGVRVKKTVTFYLMEYVSGDPTEHGWEMEEAGWFPFEVALAQLSFKGEKEALKKATEVVSV